MVPITKLRRIALERQGLLRTEPFGRGLGATLRTIQQLGYVQIDTISVVARAHHHVLATRVPNYRPEHLDRLQRRGDIFEYWAHAAAYLPMEDYRYALLRMQNHREGNVRAVRTDDDKLKRYVLDRITAEGPLFARDFEGNGKSNGWWDWKPAKRALEQLFLQGDLMIRGRDGFQKQYDLTERVLPAGTDTRMPTYEEYAAHLIDRTLKSHGFAVLKAFTYLRRGNEIRQAVKAVLGDRLDAEELVSFRLKSGEELYAEPEALEERAPTANAQVKILSPFDNTVIQRERAQFLFDFDYQIECYLPEEDRQYGYFTLPVLYKDRLIGRLDCKAHRRDAHLEIKAACLEDWFTAKPPDDQFTDAFQKAVARFAAFNDCSEVTITRTNPADWHQHLS